MSLVGLGSRWGCLLLDTPRTDPDEPDSSIRLLPRVFDGEAPVGPADPSRIDGGSWRIKEAPESASTSSRNVFQSIAQALTSRLSAIQ